MASRLAASSRDAQGFGVVLDDPIGITQELNAWRNQSVKQLDAFMQQTDREGISNQRKHTMAFALENLRVTLAEQAEQHYTELPTPSASATPTANTPAAMPIWP